jgi:hypothetical protein
MRYHVLGMLEDGARVQQKSKMLSLMAVVGRMFSSILRRVWAAARQDECGPPQAFAQAALASSW